MMYRMLAGKQPFIGVEKDYSDLYKKILTGEFSEEPLEKLSKEAKDLIH